MCNRANLNEAYFICPQDLPLLCRENKDFLPRIADLLTQLLNTQDGSEIAVVQNSLVSLFKKDAKGDLSVQTKFQSIFFTDKRKESI